MKKVLITLPNARTTYCVEVSSKSAIGRECLEKVPIYHRIFLQHLFFACIYSHTHTNEVMWVRNFYVLLC